MAGNGDDEERIPIIAPPERAIRDYFRPTTNQNYSGIVRQPINANNFELKPSLINMVQQNQFGGSAVDDPNAHLAIFLEICDTIKMNGVPDEAIQLRLFSFSLRDKARQWLQTFPLGSITSWNDLTEKFMAKFFPPSKTLQLKSEIAQFHQLDFEPLYEAWERFKELLRRCPQHGYADWQKVQYFYNGMNGHSRTIIDAAAGGTLMAKTPSEAMLLLEETTANSYLWPSERSTPRKVAGVLELDTMSALASQISASSKQIATLNSGGKQQPEAVMKISQEIVNPDTKQANYVNNRGFNNRGNQLPTHYHPGHRNHENFSYSNTRNVLQPPPGYQNQASTSTHVGEQKPSLEELLSSFLVETRARMNKADSNIENLGSRVTTIESHLKSLGTHVGQLATAINSQQKIDTFPSNTEVNPREHCKAIKLRSGMEYDEPKMPTHATNEPEASSETLHNEEGIDKQSENAKTEVKPISNSDNVLPNSLPFPQRFQKKKLDAQFSKFLEIFKKIHINIPFADALEQMPNYAKFMKNVMSRKRRLEAYETVNLTEECSAILQRKLPQKLRDPGSFTIPCTIGDSYFNKALCDLGASINLMPLSVFRKLGLGEITPSTITLQLADRSLTYPRGVIEDVLIKVDTFIFPADFVVLDMEEDHEMSLILGRPFLATGRALIDVQRGELTLRVNDDEETILSRSRIFRAQAIQYFSSSRTAFLRLTRKEDFKQNWYRVFEVTK